MSADSQRLKSALRRIVLESPELRELLGDSDNRGDQAGSAGVGTSEAEESRLCCDGSTASSANPGTSERDPDADGAGQDGLDPNDPADITSGDGTLSGVTDCATGEPVCFDGSGFIPPEGWDDPSEPPIDPTWELGKRWEVDYFDDEGSYLEYFAARPSLCGYHDCPTLECDDDLSNFTCINRDTGVTYSADRRQIDCTTGVDEACVDEDEAPRVESWPSDGCTNLAIVNGSIVGSNYDPENDGSYSAPMDEIQLCSGGEQIGLKPAANGGWKTINASTDSGYLWDSHGNKIAHIDGNEYSDPDV